MFTEESTPKEYTVSDILNGFLPSASLCSLPTAKTAGPEQLISRIEVWLLRHYSVGLSPAAREGLRLIFTSKEFTYGVRSEEGLGEAEAAGRQGAGGDVEAGGERAGDRRPLEEVPVRRELESSEYESYVEAVLSVGSFIG